MKKIFFAAIAALMMCNLSVKAQDVVDVKSFPTQWGEIASVREIFVPVEGNGLVPSIKEFLIVETKEGVGFLEKNGKGKYFYPCHEVAKMMPINAAFITADGKFVPSNLFEKSWHKFVWVNAEQEALYLDMKVMPQPLLEMCLLYPGSTQWYPGKKLLIKR